MSIVEKGDTKLVENLIFGVRSLFAEIKGWKYWITIVPDPDNPTCTGRRLRLDCQTSEAHFLPHCMKLVLFVSEQNQKPTYGKIISESPTHQEGIQIGQIWEFSDYDEGISPLLEGWFNLSLVNFQQIIDMLNNAQDKKSLKVTIQIELYGLDLGHELEMDEWPKDEKRVSVVNVIFGLGTRNPEDEII
jgi:hypothetical protein